MAGLLIAVQTVLVVVLRLLTTGHADFSNAIVHHQSADQLMRIRGLKERWGQVEVRLSSSDPTWYPVCFNASLFFGDKEQKIANWICQTRLGLTVSYAELEYGQRLSPDASFMKAKCPNKTSCTFSLGSECKTNRAMFIYCPAPESRDLSLRLTGGPDERRGRLEMMRNGEWGTICGNTFSLLNAKVVCRQMGFNESLAQLYFVGEMGVGNVTLTFTRCQGNESRLMDCFHMILGFPFEVCKESAGVECRRNDDYTPRISDGRNFTSPNGRLDLKIAGQWNAQCGKISNKTAIVACRQMGLPSSFARMLPANVKYPAQTIANITLEVRCTGQENNLLECQISQKSGPCDATFGIVCSDDPGYQVRLVGGENHTGRLEVKIAGIWGTVCDNSFYDRGAKVICRQLGFDKHGVKHESHSVDSAVPLVWPTKDIGQADPKQPIWLTSAYCSGDEGSFKDCSYKFEHNDMCSHEADVVVSCKSLEELDVPIRLAGGADNTTGRLELFYDGQWGTVCRYYFSSKSAEVACRQLGLPYTDATLINSFGDPATSPIWLNYLKCKGGESHIIQCRHYPINTSDCDPRRDAFLQCQDYTDLFKKYKPASTTVASKKNPTSGGAKTIRFDPFMIFTLVVLSSTYIFRVNTVRLVSGILSVVGAILLAIGGCCVKKKFNKWASSPGRDESSAVAAQYTPSTGHSPAETPDQTQVSLIFQKTDAPPSYSDLYGKDRASKSTPPLS